jgi:hypothetical protein
MRCWPIPSRCRSGFPRASPQSPRHRWVYQSLVRCSSTAPLVEDGPRLTGMSPRASAAQRSSTDATPKSSFRHGLRQTRIERERLRSNQKLLSFRVRSESFDFNLSHVGHVRCCPVRCPARRVKPRQRRPIWSCASSGKSHTRRIEDPPRQEECMTLSYNGV